LSGSTPKDMPQEELQQWREKAQSVAMYRKQKMSQHFGSRRKGGFPYFGKQGPALIVYEEGSSEPAAVYPHTKKRRRKEIDYSIEAFLGTRCKCWLGPPGSRVPHS